MTEIQDSLWQAATIMLTGMVVVFIFLTSLIFLVKLLAKVAGEESTVDVSTDVISSPSVNEGALSPTLVAVISSAVVQYRQRHLK